MSGHDRNWLELKSPDPHGLQPAAGKLNIERLEANRLIVLVPDQGADGNELARQIWALAAPCELQVVFLCALAAEADPSEEGAFGCRPPTPLATQPSDRVDPSEEGFQPTDRSNREPLVRLRLATLASLIRDDHVDVTTHIMTRQSWVGAVRSVWQPGDLVICCAEQTVPTLVNGRQPLCQVLSWALDVPVFVLTGLYSEPPRLKTQTPMGDIVPRIMYWAVLVTILAVFFVVEMQIDHQMVGVMRTLLLLATALVELGVIAAWSMRV